MLAQLLNQDFLVDAAEDTRSELVKLAGRVERRGPGDEGLPEEIDADDIREVAEALGRAVDELESQEEDPKAAWVCMPRDPLLAILQTELDEAVEAQAPPDVGERDPEGPVDRRLADDGMRRAADGRRAYGPFEVTRPKIFSDPKWVWSGVIIAWHKFKDKAPFGGLPDAPIDIDDDARILLVGDWGSGLERAQDVAARMRAELDRGIADGREQHVIHLGDVYYTGAEKEYKKRFLPYWPVHAGEDIGSYTLVGNHDMYRGGHAYYDTCLKDPRFSRQQGKSVFALRSPSWQFLGLDTGYEDAALYGEQPAWAKVTPAGRSHPPATHQSARDCIGDLGRVSDPRHRKHASPRTHSSARTWTDRAPIDPFVVLAAGRSASRMCDLLELASVIGREARR